MPIIKLTDSMVNPMKVTVSNYRSVLESINIKGAKEALQPVVNLAVAQACRKSGANLAVLNDTANKCMESGDLAQFKRYAMARLDGITWSNSDLAFVQVQGKQVTATDGAWTSKANSWFMYAKPADDTAKPIKYIARAEKLVRDMQADGAKFEDATFKKLAKQFALDLANLASECRNAHESAVAEKRTRKPRKKATELKAVA